MFKNSNILVTGGTGSWGEELVRQLLSLHPNKIIIYSRNENSQVELRRKMDDNCIDFFIGDIRDKEALTRATYNVDFIFHLAALKHVPICEENPLEAIKTNVIGTQNIIDAAIKNNVKKVIYVSTDKAADPVNTYGMSKALGEKLLIHANKNQTGTQFSCVRGGNLLGSSGSVLPLFKKQIAELGEVHITDTRMIRYFISPQEAISKLLKATKVSQGGEIFVLNMDAFKITDLAEVLIEHSGKSDINIIEVGSRDGEKFQEVLIAENEKKYTFVIDNDFFVVIPYQKQSSSLAPLSHTPQPRILTKNEIRLILKQGDFI